MRSRRVWGAAGAVAAGVAGVLVFQSLGGEPAAGQAAPGTPVLVKPGVRAAALETGLNGKDAVLPRQETERFSMLGVTWSDPAARINGRIEARTRAAGTERWTGWVRLDGDSGQGEDGAARGGTEPAWVGPSDGVEVRVTLGGRTTARLPQGLRLDMIDPGRGSTSAVEPAAFTFEDPADPAEPAGPPADDTAGPADSAAPSESAGPAPGPSASAPGAGEPGPSESATGGSSAPPSGGPAPSDSPSAAPSPTVPAAPPSTVPRPPITPRSGWGADEGISPEEPAYLPDGRVKAVVVHHTAESNTYSCADAAAVVRGIYGYHVKTLGWKDIGYNFLVDKCGTIYEGRKGGVDLPVYGAHAYGFNGETTGISVLGTYTGTAAPDAALASVARISAWKLGQYGADPAGTVTLTAGDSGRNYFGKTFARGAQLTLPRIHGHRDGYNTQCPGDKLYGQLPAVRSWAAGPVSGLAVKSVTGAGLAGSVYHTKSAVTVHWAVTTPAALITRYELLLDGEVATKTAGTATSARATLAPGTHKVRVRAVHQSGKTTTTGAVTVVAETTPPTFGTEPKLSLRAGTVSTGSVPVTLGWKAADNAALKSVVLTAPVARTYGPTTTSASHTARPGTSTTWSMRAADQAGNTRTAAVAAAPVILQESSARKSGSWSTKSSSGYLGGKSYSSSSKGASLSWTFTGRSAAWIVSRAAGSGQAHVYVDGKKATTIDLKSSTTKYRDAIWTKTWSSGAKHTVKIVVVGTSGRPAVTTDGLVYIK